MTKTEYFGQIREILTQTEGTDELIEFVDAQIAAIATRAEKAKEYKAKKRAEDPIYDAVLEVLTNKIMTADEITAAVNDIVEDEDEVSKQKVVARLTKAIAGGLAEKTDVKTGNGKVKGYALLGTVEALAKAEADEDAE